MADSDDGAGFDFRSLLHRHSVDMCPVSRIAVFYPESVVLADQPAVDARDSSILNQNRCVGAAPQCQFAGFQLDSFAAIFPPQYDQARQCAFLARDVILINGILIQRLSKRILFILSHAAVLLVVHNTPISKWT